jgi:hypothetical protein
MKLDEEDVIFFAYSQFFGIRVACSSTESLQECTSRRIMGTIRTTLCTHG